MRINTLTRIDLVTLLAATLTLTGCVSMVAGFRARGQQTLTAAHSPNSAVHVTTENGSVQITADPASADVVIVASITATGVTQEEADARLELVHVNADRLPDGTLDITSDFPGGRRSNDSCSLEITLPGAQGVVVQTSNGAVTLADLDGDAQVQTSNGSIRVERQGGNVTAHTSNGRVVVLNAGDSIDVQSSNGSVEIDGFNGSARAKTSNGMVICRAESGSKGPITITTSNGSVTLTAPSSMGGGIVASTSNGGITVVGAASTSGDRRHRSVRLSDSGPNSMIDTSNGVITIIVEHPKGDSPDH